MEGIILRPPTYEELQQRVADLEAEVQELRTGGAVVRSMMEKLRGQYQPADSIPESQEQWSTAQLVKKMSAIIPGIQELNVVNAMMTAGFTFDQVDGDYYWLLRGV